MTHFLRSSLVSVHVSELALTWLFIPNQLFHFGLFRNGILFRYGICHNGNYARMEYSALEYQNNYLPLFKR